MKSAEINRILVILLVRWGNMFFESLHNGRWRKEAGLRERDTRSGIVAVLEIRNQVMGFFCLDQPLTVCNMFRKSLYISASISLAVK